MKSLDLSLDALRTFASNPRTISEERLATLRESIRTFGVYSPLVVRPSEVAGTWDVLAGNARLRALLSLREQGEAIETVAVCVGNALFTARRLACAQASCPIPVVACSPETVPV